MISQVAFHLLTEGEKNNLFQLVDTMVSYSITYKASMPEHLQKFQNHGAVSDVSQLSFDPPIDQFVRFQVFPLARLKLFLFAMILRFIILTICIFSYR